MENTNELESGFQIKNLILLESSFYRINSVSFEEEVNSNLDISTEVAVNGKVITVAEEVTLVQTFQNVEQVKIKIKMVGIFECIGESLIADLDGFGRINGAAIIFPYIREHITNISLKGGIVPIILPPINFTKNKK